MFEGMEAIGVHRGQAGSYSGAEGGPTTASIESMNNRKRTKRRHLPTAVATAGIAIGVLIGSIAGLHFSRIEARRINDECYRILESYGDVEFDVLEDSGQLVLRVFVWPDNEDNYSGSVDPANAEISTSNLSMCADRYTRMFKFYMSEQSQN